MASWAEATPDWKPAKRYVATKEEWEAIHKHFEFATCVATGQRYQHLHHIAFRRADSGDDVIENLCPLTNEAHERFHKRGPGWERIAAAIRQYVIENPARRRYAEEHLGERFGRRYPPLPNSDPQFWADLRRIWKLEPEYEESLHRRYEPEQTRLREASDEL